MCDKNSKFIYEFDMENLTEQVKMDAIHMLVCYLYGEAYNVDIAVRHADINIKTSHHSPKNGNIETYKKLNGK